MLVSKSMGCALVAAASMAAAPAVDACTRAVYLGSDGLVITGRTMDWVEDIKPEDRFVRTDYFIKAIPKTVEPALVTSVPGQDFSGQAAASVLSVMRTVSTPFGLHTPGEPNNSSTLWRTVADQKNLVYFFDSATSPNAFWVDFADLDFKEGAPVKKLTMAGGRVFSGNVAARLEPAQPFQFLQASPSS